MGIEGFAESLLIVPKTLIENSGFDVQDVILELIDSYKSENVPVGVNCLEKGKISPVQEGVYDNVVAKRHWLHIAPTLA